MRTTVAAVPPFAMEKATGGASARTGLAPDAGGSP